MLSRLLLCVEWVAWGTCECNDVGQLYGQTTGVVSVLLCCALCLFGWLQRMEWGAWVAWTRVVLEAALQRTWPKTEPLEVLSKGLVGGL